MKKQSGIILPLYPKPLQVSRTPKSAALFRLRQAAARLFPVLVLVASSVILYSSSGHDDAHITYWASYSLAHHQGFYNYNGEQVEQSSSLLQVILLALATRLTGISIVTLGKLSSILFGGLTILAVYQLAARVDARAAFPAALLAATSPYFGYWTTGGMETTLIAFLGILVLLAAGDFLYQPQIKPVRLLGLLGLILAFLITRPEAPFVLVGVFLGVGGWIGLFRAENRETWFRRLLLILSMTVLLAGLVALFRIWYFGIPFPQPVIAKSANFSLETITHGFNYLIRNFYSMGKSVIVVALAIIAAGLVTAGWLAKSRRPQPHALLVLAFTAVYLAFTVFSGGDWMEGGRFIAVFIPAAVALIPFAMVRIPGPRWMLAVVTVGILLAQVKSITTMTYYHSKGIPAWDDIQLQQNIDVRPYTWFERQNRGHLKDIPVEAALKEWVARVAASKGAQEKVILYGGQMGFLPYYLMQEWYGKVHIYDRFSLIENSFTSCPVTRDLPRLSTGLQLEYPFFFEHLDEIEQTCGIPRPDIIYDIRKRDMNIVAQADYTVVYFLYGKVIAGDGVWQGGEMNSDEFIAVRNDLLARLDPVIPEIVEFDSLVIKK